MRIGFFTDSYLPRLDGIAVSVETFRKSLEELGHEVYVFCPERPEKFDIPSTRIYRFKSVSAVLYDEYRHTLPFNHKHIRTISNLNLDIVHVHTPLQMGMLGSYIARKSKIPIITTCHSDPELLKDYSCVKGFLRLVFGATTVINQQIPKISSVTNLLNFDALLGAYLNNFDLIIAPSKKIHKSLKRLGVRSAIEILPTGFDTNLLPKNSKRAEIRSNLGLGKNTVAFIATSRHVKEKRLDFLLKAYSYAFHDKTGYVFIVIGNGPQHAQLKLLTNQLGIAKQIKFLDRLGRHELVAHLQAADILVSASMRETQGLVFNEAAAVGLPVILLEKDVNPILVNKKSALVAKNSLKNYSDAMLELANDPVARKRLGQNAYKLSLEYSMTNQAKKLEQIYQKLLAKII